MKVRVLGCSGSIAAGSHTTAFLLDDDVLLDAGTGVGLLTLEQLQRIDHALLSHSHLDHVLGVPLLADSVMRQRAGRPPIQIHALPATLHALRQHVLNGVIWPDFTGLPSIEEPVLRLVPFETGQELDLGRGRRIEILPAVHTVPAVGFAVLAPAGTWVFTGDTASNAALWRRLSQLPVAHLVIETAFGDEQAAVARASRHLHPAALAGELLHFGQSATTARVHITHIKPGETDLVMSEVAALGSPHRISALSSGQVFELG